MSKIKLKLDATGLGHSGCILDLYRTVIGDINEQGEATGGYKERLFNAELTFGIAVHKFIDIAFKTKGDLIVARRHAHRLFDSVPTKEHEKKPWLNDKRYLDVVTTNVWTDFVMEEQNFDLIELVLPCWRCRGTGMTDNGSHEIGNIQCLTCKGLKQFLQPATEVTFDINYYEDDNIQVSLVGTIDMIGKMRNGPYIIGDWKTSSSWNNEGYFKQYEMSRQLNIYNLAVKLMCNMHPDSVIGQIGAKQLSAFINAIFLNKDPNKTEVIRSPSYPFRTDKVDAFQMTLDDKIKELSQAVKTGYLPKQGILNGHCIKWQSVIDQNFVTCQFWDVCRNPDNVGAILLKRDFIQKPFDPLNYNEP